MSGLEKEKAHAIEKPMGRRDVQTSTNGDMDLQRENMQESKANKNIKTPIHTYTALTQRCTPAAGYR